VTTKIKSKNASGQKKVKPNGASGFRATKAVMMGIGDIKPYPQNAKTHPQEQIVAIRRSIREFGFDQPIVVDEGMVVIKGHGRLEACLQEGIKRVPVIVRKDLTDDQKRAARIADNKVAESGWDEGMLRVEFEALELADYQLDLTGFSGAEIEGLFKDAEPPDEFPAYGADIETHYQCPKCAYEWSGGTGVKVEVKQGAGDKK